MHTHDPTIRTRILALRQDANDITNKYSEKLYKKIKFYVIHLEEHDFSEEFWENGLQEILDLFYRALEEAYKKISISLKDIYQKIKDYDIKDIHDLTYTKDGKTLEDRILLYWAEVKIRLKKQEEDPDQVIRYLLWRYNTILNTEIKTVAENLKKHKKPIVSGEIYCIQVIEGCGDNCDSNCLEYNGEYPEDEDIPWPPYHPNCNGIGYYDLTDNPDDIKDLELDDDEKEE